MKKVLKCALVLVILLLCSISVANAATTDELIAHISKTYKIAGEEVKISDTDLKKAKDYLAKYPVSEENANTIIEKIDKAVELMDEAGTANPTKLSRKDKDDLLSIGQEIASAAGVTFTYDNTDKVITIYKNGEEYTTVSLNPYFVQTGSNNTIYVVIALVAVIAIATIIGYRKMKTNA